LKEGEKLDVRKLKQRCNSYFKSYVGKGAFTALKTAFHPFSRDDFVMSS
jgi:hypothetical protein